MICGLDEAGRGPLAGPVCAAAAILPEDFPLGLLADSKKMSAAARERSREAIVSGALAWGVGWASHAEIDEINILRASLLAMRRAFDCLFNPAFENGAWPSALRDESPFGRALSPAGGLQQAEIKAVADGLYAPELPVPCAALVKADSKVPQVMAASILAKTARDHVMEHYALLYPGYGYERHKGYPTQAHRKAALERGPSPIQRLSFRVR